jgi:hypothetical protein
MDVVSISPFCAGSVLWRPRPDRFSLTVVCKATYVLAQGESTLAGEQERVRDREAYFDDDPRLSLYAPSDLAPFKPRADVILVGHAYAPRSEAVRSLVARLLVGELEKAVEVHCPRVLSREGELREGARWNKMPLRYEYAAGGLDTWNPVGIGPSAPADVYGQRPLPNLQPPGLRVTQWSDIFVPTGFGPLAPGWRVRRDKLGRRAEGWSDEGWTKIALDDDFDGEFFQAAPSDQQLDALHDDERLVLEYLNADHPSLATKLPGVHPRAFVDVPGAGPRDLIMTADTLWIDTDRGICTVTWRGQVAVDGPDQPGRVLIALEEPGQRLTWTGIAGQDSSARESTDTIEPPRPHMRTLPFLLGQSASPVLQAQAAPNAATQEPMPDTPAVDPERPRATGPRQTVQMFAGELNAMPAWVAGGAKIEAPKMREVETTQVSISIEAIRGKIQVARDEAIELVWFAPAIAARVRQIPEWEALLPKNEVAEVDVATVLTQGAPSEAALERALFESVNAGGALAPRPLLLAGEIRFPFDHALALRALAIAARPLARGNARLAEVIELVEEMAKAPLDGSPEVADGLAASVHEAWAQANRSLPQGFLTAQTERALLAQRAYQRREVLGRTWIRALFTRAGEAAPIPALLPTSIAPRLPLFPRFPARLVAEPLPPQDALDASPVILRVAALARALRRSV